VASSGDVLRRDRAVRSYFFLAPRLGDDNLILWSTRYREAIECLKRALIPADPHEITINLKLARLHRLLDEPAEAVAYHRKVVEVCQADRLSQTLLSCYR